ncbi:MAG: response regulator transcription factor [Rhizobiales bacterium]|nr:response regulator transcription factor [Hyphomicrobiales bacterium]
MKLLIIEDDKQNADYLRRGFSEIGIAAELAASGEDGLFQAAGGEFDAIIVDRMLPKVDGLTIVKTLRAAGNTTPILMLTAVSGIDDRVEGLRAGADDYLVKPFAFAELAARVSAILRRPPISTVVTAYRVDDLQLDLLTREVRRGGRRIDLQPQEFKLLEYLMRNEGRVVTRTMLLEKVWDFHFEPQTTLVETHMSRLRSKVDRGFGQELIRTVRGVGYCLRADA